MYIHIYKKGVTYMAQTTLNVRMDEDVKNALEDFCQDVGMNVSVAVNMFAKAVIREQRLPFEVTTQNRKFNDTTAAGPCRERRNHQIRQTQIQKFRGNAQRTEKLC